MNMHKILIAAATLALALTLPASSHAQFGGLLKKAGGGGGDAGAADGAALLKQLTHGAVKFNQAYAKYNESLGDTTNAANMNYQAPVTCVGTLRESYKSLKRIGWFVRSFEKELLGSHPLADWARAISYGISHPGVEQSGDLFAGYEQGKGMPAHLPTGKPVECLGRVTRRAG